MKHNGQSSTESGPFNRNSLSGFTSYPLAERVWLWSLTRRMALFAVPWRSRPRDV